jgi:hypothetical protein
MTMTATPGTVILQGTREHAPLSACTLSGDWPRRPSVDDAASDLGSHVRECVVCDPTGVRCETGRLLEASLFAPMDAR